MTGSGQAIRLRPAPGPCPYLSGHQSLFDHFLWQGGDENILAQLLESGWRHFGNYFFRPACPGAAGCDLCGKCVPIRVNVTDFTSSRSQKRTLRRGNRIEMKIGAPEYHEEKYRLYRIHKDRFGQPEAADAESFRRSFYEGSPFARECVYSIEGRTVAVSFLDLIARAASSVYCFFDPEFARFSPGTLSILREIEFARSAGIPFYYLGYWIGENRSMRYKMDFSPCEIFDGAEWKPCRAADGEFLCEPGRLRMAPS